MNVACTSETCPLVLNSKCVFYESSALPYIGVATNDSIQVSLQKIEAAVKAIVDAGGGGGAVDSVNGQVGVVVLNAGDIGAAEAGDNISIFTNDAGYLTSASTVFWRVNGTTTLNSGDTIVNHTGGLGSDLLFQRSGNTLFGITSSPASAFFGDKSQNYIQVIAGGGLVVYDPRVTPLGIIYQQDFSATFIDRSLIDRGFADNTYWKVAGSSVISDQGGALVELPYTEGGVSLDSYIKIASYWTTDPTYRAELSVFGINDGLGSAEIGFDLSAANGTARDGIRANVSTITMYGEDGAGQSVTFAITNSTPTCVFTDDRTVKKGIQYAATGYVTDPLSLTTKEYVDAIVGGITNTAAANEMMKSDGTNAVPSGVFSTSAGSLILGSAAIVGDRTISVVNTAGNASIILAPQGVGNITLNGTTVNVGSGSGAQKVIQVAGSDANIELAIYSKGASNLTLGASQGGVIAPFVLTTGTAVIPVMQLNHRTSIATVLAGIGTSLEFKTQTDTTPSPIHKIGGVIESVSTDVGNGTEAFDMIFKTMSAGATATEKLRITSVGNIGMFGATTFDTGVGVLAMLNATTAPAASDPNQIMIYSKDSSDGAANATLALQLEQAVEAIGTFTASHKIKVWINTVEYWIQLDAV